MDEIKLFFDQCRRNAHAQGEDEKLRALSRQWMWESSRHKYSYNFTWMGRPIIQLPQDIVAIQEIIWTVKPDLIIETGIAHGGSLILHASMLELLGGDGRVAGIDVDLRAHNRAEIDAHPLAKRIELIDGSSVDTAVAARVAAMAKDKHAVLVILDSNHTHAHVLRELALYSPLVTPGSYLVVLDTIIEDMPEDFYPDRSWGRGDNPKTAVHEFLKQTDRFTIDKGIEDKLMITMAPDGYLRCLK